MTTPEERLPVAGTAEPGSEHDPELSEAYAESVGIDPSHHEIMHPLVRFSPHYYNTQDEFDRAVELVAGLTS